LCPNYRIHWLQYLPEPQQVGPLVRDGPRGAGPPLQGGARGVRDQAEGQWQWAAAGRGPGGEAITEGPVHPRTVHKSCLVP